MELESSECIHDLKKAIKKKTPRFDDIPADELALCQVSIPDIDDLRQE